MAPTAGEPTGPDEVLSLQRRLADAGREIDAVLADLPPEWQAAARGVNETGRHYGAPATLQIALACCDWWDRMDRSLDSPSHPAHTNLAQRQVVARLRGWITALLNRLAPLPRRRKGMPRRRVIDPSRLDMIKAEYRRIVIIFVPHAGRADGLGWPSSLSTSAAET